jgi:hypothetical protein
MLSVGWGSISGGGFGIFMFTVCLTPALITHIPASGVKATRA